MATSPVSASATYPDAATVNEGGTRMLIPGGPPRTVIDGIDRDEPLITPGEP
jgi:hypothetical protein